jgi:hypothetical protein
MSYISGIRPQDIEDAQENLSWYGECASAPRIYAYVQNDPLNRTDPTGRDWSSIGASFSQSASQYGLSTAATIASGQILLAQEGELPEEEEQTVTPISPLGAGSIVAVPGSPVNAGNIPLIPGPGGTGDLTSAEINQIQAVVNQAGRPLEVVGSAARGARQAGSDIDYVAPPSSLEYFGGLETQLPGIDPTHGIIPGVGNPNIGPVIRFEPQ